VASTVSFDTVNTFNIGDFPVVGDSLNTAPLHGTDGKKSVIPALSADGQQKWQTALPAVSANSYSSAAG